MIIQNAGVLRPTAHMPLLRPVISDGRERQFPERWLRPRDLAAEGISAV
jgi:hypothetical protein